MADSPAGDYLNNTDSRAGNTTAMSTTGLTDCKLQFLVNWNVADDELRVAVSTNGGANFIDVWAESGSSGGTQWVQIGDNTSFPNLDGHASLHFRWRLVSNASVTADGAAVDQVAVRCKRPTYTSALRTQSSPVHRWRARTWRALRRWPSPRSRAPGSSA